MGIASGLAHHVHRRTLTLGNTTHMLNVLLVDEQTHAFLTLVGDDLLRRQGLVADGQLGHIDLAATLLDQLGETVQVACRTVVVDGDDGVDILLTERTHEVVGTLLHLRVGTLHGIQLDAVAVATRVDRRHRAAAQTDAVVVATDHHHLVALLRLLLQTVALGAIAHTASQHDDFVVSVFSWRVGRLVTLSTCRLVHSLLMLEGEHRTADEGLTELVAEVTGTVRCLDQNLLRRLIEPLTDRKNVFPITPSPPYGPRGGFYSFAVSKTICSPPRGGGEGGQSWVCRHIHSGAGDGP